MIRQLSTKIGIVSLLLILIIALSSVMVNAQTPAVTVTVTSPPPTNAPSLTSFTITVMKAGTSDATPPTGADVKIEINLNNANLSTNTPSSTEGPVTGLLKFCIDMPATSTATPGATAVIPTITNDTVQTLPGNCIVTVNNTMTFQNVPIGEHEFAIELVNLDGSSMNPKVHFDTKMYVFPPQ